MLVQDPVCGIALDPHSFTVQYIHAGNTYHFCSKNCLDRFRVGPEQFLNLGSWRKATARETEKPGIDPTR